MEPAVRHLRDGALPDAAACATCCILDNLSIIGGTLVLRHAVQSFIAAMRQGRSQGTSIRLVDLTGALAEAATSTASIRRNPAHPNSQPAPEHNVELIDLFSDPWGWRQLATASLSPELPAESDTNVLAGTAPKPAPQSLAVSLSALQEALLRPPQQSQPLLQENTGAAPVQPPDKGDGSDGLAKSAVAATAAGTRSVCVLISCFSTLMERYGDWQALALLEAVQRSPVVSCVLTSLHTDLHPAQLVFAVRRLSSCCVDLSPLSELQTEVAQRALLGGTAAAGGSGGDGDAGDGGGERSGGVLALAGRLDCRTKRRTGRVKVESVLYSLIPSKDPGNGPTTSPTTSPTATRLAFHPVPPVLDAPDPKTLVRLQPPGSSAAVLAATAAQAVAPVPAGAPAAGRATVAGGGEAAQPVGLLGGVTNPEELAWAVGGGMRLTLTEEERRAKEQVVLPYQHQGQQHRRGALAAAYAAGDHAGYLPPAAGGTGPAAGGGGQQALGHILYVRDSASEADSDQELDEDLDI